jgi:hypothetical protein
VYHNAIFVKVVKRCRIKIETLQTSAEIANIPVKLSSSIFRKIKVKIEMCNTHFFFIERGKHLHC